MARGKILLVDDDPDILKLLKSFLELQGYSTITAEDGQRALECFEKEKPDLVLLDVLMPGMDGWEVLKAIRERSSLPEGVSAATVSRCEAWQGLLRSRDH